MEMYFAILPLPRRRGRDYLSLTIAIPLPGYPNDTEFPILIMRNHTDSEF
jgi:hypothetical protein